MLSSPARGTRENPAGRVDRVTMVSTRCPWFLARLSVHQPPGVSIYDAWGLVVASRPPVPRTSTSSVQLLILRPSKWSRNETAMSVDEADRPKSCASTFETFGRNGRRSAEPMPALMRTGSRRMSPHRNNDDGTKVVPRVRCERAIDHRVCARSRSEGIPTERSRFDRYTRLRLTAAARFLKFTCRQIRCEPASASVGGSAFQ